MKEMFFCFGKKGFCKEETCDKCEFCDGEGGVDGEAAARILSELFGDEYDLDRLRDLVQADREGRCKILPCKTGDTVYQIEMTWCKWMDSYKCDQCCSGYGECWEGEKFVKEVKFELWMIACIGKTVFLSREEAEAALKGENENGMDQR